MIFSENFLGILLAFTSAIVWGSGDFSGGLAARKNTPFQVLALSALSGTFILIVFAILWREAIPGYQSIIWSLLAGTCGAIGIASLYKALSISDAAIVAPVSAVIAAAMPVIIGVFLVGIPSITQSIGFLLAITGIWLVSGNIRSNPTTSGKGFSLALLAGIAFGSFFILIAQVETGKIFIPLIFARTAQFLIALILLLFSKQQFPSSPFNPIAILAGILDAGGNLFFLLAKQFTRFDIAAVLSSLYPAATVLLAALILKQKVSKGQLSGLVICLLATIIISV
jgi:drug/metabolite transporter (DMT)-like permease